MERSKLANRVSEYKWDWFATLKLDFSPYTRRHALEAFEGWLTNLEQREGGRHFRWVRVLMHDANWNNVYFLVLVGGLHNRRRYYEQHWSERAGRAQIERFDPSLPGIRSMLKAMDHDGDPDIDYGLPRRSHRRRD
jgi:hypothetical protein